MGNFRKQVDSLGAIYRKSKDQENFSKITQDLDSAYNEIVTNERNYLKKFVDDNKTSLVSIFALYMKFIFYFVWIRYRIAQEEFSYE